MMAMASPAGRRRPGRPRRCPDEVLIRVIRLREAGMRQIDVCALMNAEGVPTPGGGARWYPSHISRLLATTDAQSIMDGEDLPVPGNGPSRAVNRWIDDQNAGTISTLSGSSARTVH